MRAILKKDLCNYFSNPIGYVFFSVFFAISGYLFYISVIVARSSDLSYFFSMLFNYILLEKFHRLYYSLMAD